MEIKPIVLKLGGSVITDKNKVATANLDAIERLAGEIAQSTFSYLILVHAIELRDWPAFHHPGRTCLSLNMT